MSTPEGTERLNKALKAFDESHAVVANVASRFLIRYAYEIKRAMQQSDDKGAMDELNDVLDTIATRTEAQEEFLRALAGHPAAK